MQKTNTKFWVRRMKSFWGRKVNWLRSRGSTNNYLALLSSRTPMVTWLSKDVSRCVTSSTQSWSRFSKRKPSNLSLLIRINRSQRRRTCLRFLTRQGRNICIGSLLMKVLTLKGRCTMERARNHPGSQSKATQLLNRQGTDSRSNY